MTSTLLWDLDGTLIDTTALIVNALGDAFRALIGCAVPVERLRAMIGIPLHEQIRLLLVGPECGGWSGCDDPLLPVRLESAVIDNYERHRSREHHVTEAVDALIEGKRRGFKTAVVTSKNDRELAHTLPRLGISPYCDAIVGADQVAPDYKPHPRPVQLALSILGTSDPAEALFIGDSVHDMRSGHAAGVQLGAVLWGAATAEALRRENPDHVFERPQQLLAFITSLEPGLVAA